AGGAVGPAEAAGDFQPTFVVAADDGPAPPAEPDEGGAEWDDGAAAGDTSEEVDLLACRVTSLPESRVLANPGLAKPAPVSSRANAAAASVDVSSCDPPPCDPPPCDPPGCGPWRDGPAPGNPLLASVASALPAPGVLAAAGRC